MLLHTLILVHNQKLNTDAIYLQQNMSAKHSVLHNLMESGVLEQGEA